MTSSALTDALHLQGPVVIVAHDWGGSIGLGWAEQHLDMCCWCHVAQHRRQPARTESEHPHSSGWHAQLRYARRLPRALIYLCAPPCDKRDPRFPRTSRPPTARPTGQRGGDRRSQTSSRISRWSPFTEATTRLLQ